MVVTRKLSNSIGGVTGEHHDIEPGPALNHKCVYVFLETLISIQYST